MQILRAASRRRRREERGAVAVEAALVLPMIILLIFGMIEFSLMLRDYVAITSATRTGSRLASAAAGDGSGGCDSSIDGTGCVPASVPKVALSAASTMQNALGGVPANSVNYILVYKANSTGYPGGDGNSDPTVCSANCVKFTWNPNANGTGKGAFRYSSGSWNSTSINACVNNQDSVGIYLNVTHRWITGLFGTSMIISDRSVMKFEPLPTETCLPNKHP